MNDSAEEGASAGFKGRTVREMEGLSGDRGLDEVVDMSIEIAGPQCSPGQALEVGFQIAAMGLLRSAAKAARRDRPRNADSNADNATDESTQLLFESLAANNQDTKFFIELRKLRQNDRSLSFDERKLVVLEERAALDQPVADVKQIPILSEPEKVARMRELFGIPQ